MNFPRSASFGLKVTAATRLGESRCTFDRPPFFSPAHRSLNVSSTGKCRTFVLLSVVKKKRKKTYTETGSLTKIIVPSSGETDRRWNVKREEVEIYIRRKSFNREKIKRAVDYATVAKPGACQP